MRCCSIRTIAFVVVAFSALLATAFSQTVSGQKTAPTAPVIANKDTVKKAVAAVAVTDSASPVTDSLVRKLSAFRVVTVPESAQVYLGDSLAGVTPCTVADVVPGEHQLTLKKVGCYLKKARITVDSTGTQEFTFPLLQPAFVRVESGPAGAELSIDGKKTGVTPWENDKVKPGEYTVMLTLGSYKSQEKKVTVASAAVDTVRFTLEHTDEYQDSVAAVALAARKAQKERFHGMLATALFALGAVIILVMEMTND